MKRDVLVFITLFFYLPLRLSPSSSHREKHDHYLLKQATCSSVSTRPKTSSPLALHSYTAKELLKEKKEDIKEQYLSLFLNEPEKTCFKTYMEEKIIIKDGSQEVKCQIQSRPKNTQLKTREQKFTLTSLNECLHGPLGNLLKILHTVNAKAERIHWICHCKATEDSLHLYSPSEKEDPISISVPKNTPFNVTVEKKQTDDSSKYYLTIYESNMYKLKT